MKNLKPVTLLLLLAFLLAACATPAPEADGKIRIVTTIGMLTDITQIVGGEHVSVQGLMGPGVDPHLYTASESDVTKLSEADVIIANGLFLEAQMDSILEQLAERKTVILVGETIDTNRLLESPVYADEFDPHIWFSVPLWMEAVKAVAEGLSAHDPAHAADYAANAAAYLVELETLNTYVHEQASRLTAEQRVLVTAHDAFSYFGREYGFEVLGLQGISTASEASAADVQNLAGFIAERQVPAIFVESSVPVRTVEALQAAVEARGFDVAIGGSLFSDAMGNWDTPEGTYIGMVRHNIDTIVNALLGE